MVACRGDSAGHAQQVVAAVVVPLHGDQLTHAGRLVTFLVQLSGCGQGRAECRFGGVGSGGEWGRAGRVRALPAGRAVG